MTEPAKTSPPAASSNPLDEIDAALASGSIEVAQRLTEPLVRGPSDSVTLEAAVLLRLGYCDLAMSKVERARGNARRAAALFKDLAEPGHEVEALALRSRAASVLGRSVEAVETALLATHLARDLPEGIRTLRAHLSLAIAHGRARAFGQSTAEFDTARAMLSRCGETDAELELDVEQAWVLILRCAFERQGINPPDAIRLVDFTALSDAALSARAIRTPLTPGASASLREAAKVASALISLWQGHPERAKELLKPVAPTHSDSSPAGWLLAALSWLRAELACCEGDVAAAGLHAGRMAAWAREVEDLPLASIGHRLAAAIHELQGQTALALAETRQQLACEYTMQTLHLEGREELTQLQISSRLSEVRIENLAAKSSKFERWAHEDPLTGIPNVRRFNECLGEWSAAAVNTGASLCVALIDVDSFREINNNYSYETGNDALRGIAQEMVAHVRPSDLPARWGGDEFAILFRDLDLEAALRIAERIQAAVRDRDWSSVAQGLKVSISVGVTKALPGDDKKALIARSEQTMYEQKVANKQRGRSPSLQPAVLRKVASWLAAAQRVVVVVGSGTEGGSNALSTGNFGAWGESDRRQFGHIEGFRTDSATFLKFWSGWRETHAASAPIPVHSALVALAPRLRQVTFVTERIDGMLQRSGADNVVELYGNVYRDRCSVCNNLQPLDFRGDCLSCKASAASVRPDIALLGAAYKPVHIAEVEFLFKRSDVVLVVDCDATTYPSSGMLEKARSRDARIVMMGVGDRTRRSAADVVIDGAPEDAISHLAQILEAFPSGTFEESELTDACFDVVCFLTGQKTDNFGFSFEQAMSWKDWEIERHLGTIPWIFPLTTSSRMNPDAPMPSGLDFEYLAADARVQNKVREAFLRMLSFYGFAWHERQVRRSTSWQNGFATWVVTPSHHDLFISRILGSLRLFGLRAEALAFLEAIETEVREYRRDNSQQPLWHWRMAVHGTALLRTP